MKKIVVLVIISTFLLFPLLATAQKSKRKSTLKLQSPQNAKIGFVIHGGAGVIRRGSLTPEREKAYREKLEEAVLAGYNALKAGKTSLDAIEAAINIMEDSPMFNAGKGAVFTADGKNELDASVMDGKTQNAGAVAGLHKVKKSDNAGAGRNGEIQARDDDRRWCREVCN